MKKKLFGLMAACLGLMSCNDNNYTANYRVVPLPQEITETQGESFILDKNTQIVYSGNEEMKRNAEFLAEYIKEKTCFELAVTDKATANAITLTTGEAGENPEGYRLTADHNGITVIGATEAGVFYGVQTLRKAIPFSNGKKVAMPAVEISDYPRFAYRGAHLDVSRHFFNTDSIKRFIDILALHNINRFHWHLTDDQGWRIEIKKYPKLSTIAAERDETVIGKNSGEYDGIHYGPYLYTQEECREIVNYAAERHVTVIPEIDLPGHIEPMTISAPIMVTTEVSRSSGPWWASSVSSNRSVVRRLISWPVRLVS